MQALAQNYEKLSDFFARKIKAQRMVEGLCDCVRIGSAEFLQNCLKTH